MENWDPRTSQHPSQEVWEEYVFERLTEEQTAPIEEHLLICETCQHSLEETEQFILAAKVAAATLEAAPRRRWWDAVLRPQAGPRLLWGASGVMAVALAISAVAWKPAQPAPVAVALTAVRGGRFAMTHAKPGTPLELTIDLQGLLTPATYRIQMVNADGRATWEVRAEAREPFLVTLVPRKLPAGTYWVRVYSDAAELLREFGLELG